jgi:DNA-directed RNA polymerase specialized sigma24 family protein
LTTATIETDTLNDNLDAAIATSAGAELLALLGQAVAAGQLDPKAATLIGRCRVSGASADQLAAELGVQAQSVRRNRQRAERQLVAAAA